MSSKDCLQRTGHSLPGSEKSNLPAAGSVLLSARTNLMPLLAVGSLAVELVVGVLSVDVLP